jgi:hypothetical protein
MDDLRMMQQVQRIALQSLLAQLMSEMGSAGLEQVRIRAVAILASASDHPRQLALQDATQRLFDEVYEAAGRQKPESNPWGGDA